MFGQEPPTYLRSTTATPCPAVAKVQAGSFASVPQPMMTRSYSSVVEPADDYAEGPGLVVFMERSS